MRAVAMNLRPSVNLQMNVVSLPQQGAGGSERGSSP